MCEALCASILPRFDGTALMQYWYEIPKPRTTPTLPPAAIFPHRDDAMNTHHGTLVRMPRWGRGISYACAPPGVPTQHPEEPNLGRDGEASGRCRGGATGAPAAGR